MWLPSMQVCTLVSMLLCQMHMAHQVGQVHRPRPPVQAVANLFECSNCQGDTSCQRQTPICQGMLCAVAAKCVDHRNNQGANAEVQQLVKLQLQIDTAMLIRLFSWRSSKLLLSSAELQDRKWQS